MPNTRIWCNLLFLLNLNLDEQNGIGNTIMRAQSARTNNVIVAEQMKQNVSNTLIFSYSLQISLSGTFYYDYYDYYDYYYFIIINLFF